ncbi:hypothetical protein NLG97_g1682 [Lecanicillium saksenae]|uniref:Uncharacterized protein n=1 Tax=Lecanicillium saksenae TaxID=468837 RepID=A0ACC1R339_9HYPO|nr:hypothetical protein NLG97_g1682 [Lecanicillium saksenae]
MMLGCATFAPWLLLVSSAAGQPEHAHFAAYLSQQLPLVAAANDTDSQACHRACESLAATAGNDIIVHYGTIPDSFTSSFYAVQQRKITPLCVAQPQTVDGVSMTVRAVTKHRCRFAIKSGGHSNAPGTNARQDGLVIDLKALNSIEISRDNSTVLVGPGNIWSEVYEVLEPYGLVVSGGRVGSVGVGGFTMGGGISYLSRQYGWAVNNVRSFEVVLPNGTITNASPGVNPDLYFALRGGGSSFGIVTRFDFEAFPHDAFWGGSDICLLHGLSATEKRLSMTSIQGFSLQRTAATAVQWLLRGLDWLGYAVNMSQIAESFTTLAHETQTDLSAHAYLFISNIPYVGTYITGSTYVYSKGQPNPAALAPLTGVPHVHTTRGLPTLSKITKAITDINPLDARQHWRTSTFRVDAGLIVMFSDIFLQESAPIRWDIPDALVSSNVQLVTKHELDLFQKNGGNAFGLGPEDGPLMFISMSVAYKHAKDDDAVESMTKRIHERIEAVGKEMGLHHPFIYPNYAAVGQDVFAGYKQDNLKRLLNIQARYDPGRVFANLQPAHLTLNEERVKRYTWL